MIDIEMLAIIASLSPLLLAGLHYSFRRGTGRRNGSRAPVQESHVQQTQHLVNVIRERTLTRDEMAAQPRSTNHKSHPHITTCIRVTWTDGSSQRQDFVDKFEAQDKVVELQMRGISPRVDRIPSDGQSGSKDQTE